MQKILMDEELMQDEVTHAGPHKISYKLIHLCLSWAET